MVTASDIKVVLPCLFPTKDPVWMMLHTCKVFGIDPHCYGIGETYAGWVDIKIKKLRKVAQEVLDMGYSHLLYSDARDAWFLAGLDEVAEAYNGLEDPPILLSAQARPFCGGYNKWYDMREWETGLDFPYLGTPGIMAHAEVLRDALTYMEETYPFDSSNPDSLPDDDPPWWISYMVDFPGAVALDNWCEIFLNAGDCPSGCWDIVNGKVYNSATGSWPKIIHFNGGSSDAVKGKWESLEPVWRKLGYSENPPWEAA